MGRLEAVMRKVNYAATVNKILPCTAAILRQKHRKWGLITGYCARITLDRLYIEAYLILRILSEPLMPRPAQRDSKSQELARDGALNPHPETVRDPLFAANPFFDPKDLVQVRYEMVRRYDADGMSITDIATSFGVSRPTFYKAQSTLAASGLAGLVPRPRGPKGGHKISTDVVAFIVKLKAEQPELTTPECLAAIQAQFGITVHRRSVERALARKKKSQVPAR
jgi:transposase